MKVSIVVNTSTYLFCHIEKFLLKLNVNYMYLYKYKEGGTMHGHRKKVNFKSKFRMQD